MVHRARTRGRRPRGSTRTPVWGATWQGVGIWRAHGLVGPGESIGAVTQMRYRDAIFNRIIPFILFRVGLCSHTVLFFCKLRGGSASVGFCQDDDDRMDPSPRDHQCSTCGNIA